MSVAKKATKQSAPKQLWNQPLSRFERQCWAQGYNTALIDSAGGAKAVAEREFFARDFYEDAKTGKVPWPGNSTPQPAECDGAVEMHVRHEGSGLLALYNGDKQIREIGITPGWHFKDRDEFIFRYNNYTRPAATAVVPEGFVLVPKEPTYEMRQAGEWAKTPGAGTPIGYGATVAYRAMIAAAPATGEQS